MMDAVGGFQDITEGFRLTPLWSRLAWEQTVARFRRTILGPFWLTANLLAISFSLAFVSGALSGSGYRSNFSLIIGGVLTWGLIGGVLNEAAGVFISSGPLMHTMKLPLSFHVLLMMQRAFINFLAQLVAFWFVLSVMRLAALPTWPILITIPLLLANMSLMSLLVAVPSTRFRDIHQTVQFVVQVMFFLTPIFWSPVNVHGVMAIIVNLNPLTHLLELVREPLLGRVPAVLDWEWGVGIFLIQLVAVLTVLGLYRRRVVFWL